MNPRPSSKLPSTQPARTHRYTRHLLLAALAVAPAAAAQTAAPPNPTEQPGNLKLEPAATPKKNRLGLSMRFGFNVKARFKNVSSYPANTDPGPDPALNPGFAGVRYYDDGFVGPDATYPNNDDQTVFYGYNNAAQVGATDLLFHSAPPATGTDHSASPDQGPLGFEVTYARELKRNQYGSWGIEFGGGWTYLSIRDNGNLFGQVNVTEDAYSLGTPPVVPPEVPPPFVGTPTGTDYAAIGDTPTRSPVAAAAAVTGWRRLSADLYTLRLGPYFDYRLSRLTSLQGGVGAAAVVVNSRFSYSEATATAFGTINRSGKDSDTDVRFGPYAMAQFITEFSRRTYLFAGVQFYMLGDDSLTAGSKEVELDLGSTLFAHAGLAFSF